MNNIPVIIFDGPDNVGKGTQIKLLRKHFKETAFAITNMDKPVGDDLDAKERYGLEAATSQLVTIHSGWHSKAPQIADRAYFSEYAYSVLRKKHQINTILEIEKDYSEMQGDVLGLIFIDEVENISARDDGNSNYSADDIENIKNIIDNFVEIAEKSIFDVRVININGKDIKVVQTEVNDIVWEKFPNLK